LTQLPAALYERTPDGRYAATELTRGPWSTEHQHAGPPAALLASTVEEEGRQVARLSFDILGPVPIAPLRLSARVLRPGKRVEQVEAELSDDDRVLMRLTAWRFQKAESRKQRTGEVEVPPGPETGEPGRFDFWRDEIAYRDALEWSFVEGQFDVPGPATVWTRVRVPLIAGEEIKPLERLLVMADAASGVSAALDWAKWSFVNVDLGIHLLRAPVGEWMAMDARTTIGPTGMGLCTSQLFDAGGAVGASTQSLLVAER
jgi:hypothetical protein